tara:strand:- start:1243 stop:1647 length:405 start_codon:yes stop_codon:yes gene_type:complete
MGKRIGKYKVSKKEDALSLKSDLAGGGHIKSVGTVPTLTVTTAGDGTCTISAESTDVAGTVTFADTWANSDTLLVTFNKPYATAPKVLLSSHVFNASGANLLEFDAVVATTTGFTITASGTCAGALTYFVVETV